MLNRCLNSKNKSYKSYGGRGISVHPDFLVFQNFFNYVGKCPKGLTLDRIDNDGNYEPGNLRWASAEIQSHNKSTNVRTTFDGVSLTLDQLAKRTGVPYGSLYNRLVVMGLTAEEAVNYVKYQRTASPRFNYQGRSVTVNELSSLSGLPYQRLWSRIHRQGMTAESAVEKG